MTKITTADSLDKIFQGFVFETSIGQASITGITDSAKAQILALIAQKQVEARIEELELILSSRLCQIPNCDIEHRIPEDFIKARIEALKPKNRGTK